MNTKEPHPSRPGASPDGLPPLRDIIKDHDLKARKSLSQNFLLDLNLTRKIARLAGPLEGKTVIEIGPGPGGLTRALFLEGAARVIAVERDARCLVPLQQIAEHYQGQVEIHELDALKANWPQLCRARREEVIIVANLPYAIATKLLVGWLETEPWPPWFGKMVLMFQRKLRKGLWPKRERRPMGD